MGGAAAWRPPANADRDRLQRAPRRRQIVLDDSPSMPAFAKDRSREALGRHGAAGRRLVIKDVAVPAITDKGPGRFASATM
jgi:hypothetical protein